MSNHPTTILALNIVPILFFLSIFSFRDHLRTRHAVDADAICLKVVSLPPNGRHFALCVLQCRLRIVAIQRVREAERGTRDFLGLKRIGSARTKGVFRFDTMIRKMKNTVDQAMFQFLKISQMS
jgi:hypothetical protein